MAEFPSLGKQCAVDSCKQLDFLPFECDGCGNTYCLQHKSKDDHMCSKHLLRVGATDYMGPKASCCALEGCSHKELMLITCQHCYLNFCLSHRHEQDHKCTQLKTAHVSSTETGKHVAQISTNKGAQRAPKPLKLAKSQRTAAHIALMKLKGRANGDQSILSSERVFFNIVFPLSVKLAPRAFYFSVKWSAGRAVDYIASVVGIHNPNNTGAEKKLRLFAGHSGLLLPVDQNLESLLTDEFGIFSGSSLILESVLNSAISLPDLEKYRDLLDANK